ncbi:amino acid adenylation domain-containing protein [Nocardia sp. NBC_00508]|uniref:amino acid adenylation domain-containing protein n=1 Tax=Nocardia sp. NBC_00508 TaxID=2975992 RepID=UPI002E80607D|nr:amino acid adenylation domain-containing protein [Nocardia sp. NBC_00508]WUD63935.1 amino acid adenylation domain-containing protein [Nocardia sp. NBC_00508]
MTHANASSPIGTHSAPGDRANARRAYGIDDLPGLIATVAELEPWRVALRHAEVVVTYAALAAELAALSEAMGSELGADALVPAVVSSRLPTLLETGEVALGAVLDALLDDALTAARDVLAAPAPAETLVSQFEDQVRRTPDAVALEYAGATLAHPSPGHHPSSTRNATLTYAEFGGRVNALARHLIALGVGPETLVGLAVRRSFDLLVGMYAILEAGGAYLPIDPDQPADQIAAVLAVAEPVVVLTTTRDEPGFGAEVPTFRIDRFEGLPTPHAPAVARSADDIAYVIVTSDSTGRPEGVAVSHRSIVANLRWRQRLFRLRADDVVLQWTPCRVDMSVWEFFWPLQVGARLVIAAPDGHRDPAHLSRVIHESGVTAVHFVPSALAAFVADRHVAAPDSLRMVFASGEELPVATAAAFRDLSGATLYHLYGPTEAAIDVTAHEVTAADVTQVPIGVAADDTEMLVLDEQLRPVPPGVVGELYVSGVQLARGYVAAPGSTAERFVANPEGPAGERMYRTGERVRWSNDGELIHLGRLADTSLDGIHVTTGTGEAGGGRIPVRALFDAAAGEGLAAARRPPLATRDRPEWMPLSPAQRRLWFLNRIESQDGADSVDNLPLVLRLTGRLDIKALERAVLDVLTRHATLRTVYPETDSGPCQSVPDAADIGLSLHAVPIDRSAVDDAVAGIVRAGFDLTTELPSRVALLAVDRVDRARGVTGDEYVLVFVVHHIAADARSLAPLVTDLLRAYLARLTSRRPGWDALPVQYADYSLWHDELLGVEDLPGTLAYQQLRFWRELLDGAPAQLPLPTDRPRPAVASQRGAAVDFVITPEVTAGLRALARRGGATLFMTLHAAFAATLARLSGSADIVIGSPVTGRAEPALDGLVGRFGNTVALRTRVTHDISFAALLRDVRDGDSAAFANADLPFERLVDAVPVARRTGAHPLFQVMFSFEAAAPVVGGKALEVPWLSVRPVEVASTGAKFDLHLIVGEKAGSAGLSGSLRYATDLFDAATVESYVARFRRMLVAVAVDPDARIGDIELLSDAERALILREWNATVHAIGESRTLASLFVEQVARTPDAPAVTFEGATLSYDEFAGRVNRLARWLVARGVGPEALVALRIRQSIDLAVGMYAIIEAGGAYLPLDPDRPDEHILATAAPVYVLTAGSDLNSDAAEIRIDRLDLSGHPDTPLSDADRRAPLRPANTAYVLFTSGSAGVVMSHGGIVNRLRWMQSAYAALGPGDVLLQKTPVTLDVSVPEFFWPLQAGARMVLARPDGHRDPAYLARLIRSEGVTVAHFVPSMLAAFVAEAPEVPSLREVFCSGEALPGAVAQRMREFTGACVHNGYGPAEAAVEVTFHEVSDADFETVPIGKPIWNTRTYVLDARLRPVPVGVPGELYLAGAQLARGYLGWPGRTGDRFVADPIGPAGERMYRTGDLVVWTAAGELEFLDRSDALAQIRGLRIDLGEIESALLAVPGIGQAAALVRDDRGTSEQLVAYLVANGPVEIATVRDAVAERLPGYLVPQAFVLLDRFPMDAAGKLDRTALPAPAFEPAVYRTPSGAAEKLVAEAFTALLGVTEVGADDDFFALGGDSLNATQLAARLSKATGAEVVVRTIFDAPTVRALAQRITADRPIETGPFAMRPVEAGPVGLSLVGAGSVGQRAVETGSDEVSSVETGSVELSSGEAGSVELSSGEAGPVGLSLVEAGPVGPQSVETGPVAASVETRSVGLRSGEAESVEVSSSGPRPLGMSSVEAEPVGLSLRGTGSVAAPVEAGAVELSSGEVGPVGPRSVETGPVAASVETRSVGLPSSEAGSVEDSSGESGPVGLSLMGTGPVAASGEAGSVGLSPVETGPIEFPPLTPQERSGPTPLSIAQQRMWFLNRFDTTGGGYNITFALRLTGALNVPALEAAIADVIARHETLRTLYPEQDGVATQVVLPAGTKLVELVARPVAAAQVSELVGAATRAGFDVTAEVPLRVRLLRVEGEAPIAGQVHVLLFVVHHIAADGWSFAPLTRDLTSAYVARCASIAPAWGPLPVQYADFAIWQRAALGSASDPDSVPALQLAYWTDRLSGLPEVLALPSDRLRPAVATNRGGALTGRLDAALHQQIRDFAAARRVTPFMVLHTALAVLLSRYGACADVAIGTPVAGRGEEALDDLVGAFVNTLVLRTEVRQNATLAELLASVRAADLAAFDHAAVPFARVVEAVNPVRSPAHAPLYQVALTVRNQATPAFRLHRLAIAVFEVGPAPTHLDLDWTLTDRHTADGAPDGIDVQLRYALDLFDAPTVAGFLAAFERVLRAMVRDARTLVGNAELMSVAERGMLLSDHNATTHTLPGETLDDLLTARVAATPDEVGLRYEGSAITYAEFASQVNRLARRLIAAGVGPETVVGLAALRSIDMLVSMYAIVRAGGAYLPIDPARPADHLAQVVATAAPRLVLTAGGAALRAPDGVHVLDLADLDLDGVADGPVSDDERIAALRPENTAYVLFTSGSTGYPNRVAVTHRAILNQLRWLEFRYRVTASDRILQHAPLTSDVSVWECFLPIAAGAPLVIARPGGPLDPGYVAGLLREHRITIAEFAPSMPAALISAGMGDALRSVRHLRCGGAALTPALLAALRGSVGGAVHHAYGTPEVAVSAICHEFTEADAESVRNGVIGRPCWNTRVYVLDARVRPVPIGVTGELYLAGDQLARGYPDRPGRTAERFVADPFGVPGRLMYRTGDLVRWNRTGELVYSGAREVEFTGTTMDFRAPREGIEAVLATLVADLVGAARIGADDDFFARGGNSLLAVRLVARVNTALACSLTVREVFQAPTVAQLARRIARSAGLDATEPSALVPGERPARIPLSPAQNRMWLRHRLDPDSGVYNTPIAIRLTGALDYQALRTAVRDVIDRHEALRSIFPADAEGPAQVVLAGADVPEPTLHPIAVTEPHLREAVLATTADGFDLRTRIPVRATLFRVAPDNHVLAVVVHHIAADGVSTTPLVRDLMTAYTARVAGEAPQWRPLPVQYPDFTLWQHDVLGSADDPASVLSNQIAYWRAELSGLAPLLELPTDRPRPPVASGRGATVEFAVPPDLTGLIAELARRHSASTFMVLHAAFATLLARLTGVDDIAIGSTVAGRADNALSDLIGRFADTVVLRTPVPADMSFAELLVRVRDIDVRAFAHADLPFARLIEELDHVRSQAYSPIVQTMLTFEHRDDTVLGLPGLTVSAYPFDNRVAQVDLAMEFTELSADAGTALRGVLRYATDLFDRDTVEAFAARFTRVLRAVVADASVPVGDLELLDAAERALVLDRWNDTTGSVAPAATLISLFEAQVARTPDAPAVTVEGRVLPHPSPDHHPSWSPYATLTYSEFAGRVRRLARWLVGQGVGPDAPVALGMRRSLDMVVGIYAITLAGGAYVPLDPADPTDRLEYVLRTVRPVCVLTSGLDLDAGAARQIRIDRLDLSRYSAEPLTALDRLGAPEPAHTAYVIFTSGSAEGVAVSHAAIVKRLTWMQSAYPLSADDAVLQHTQATFAASVWELFWPLVFGARLVLAWPDAHRDPAYLARVIIEQRVTTVHFEPPLLGVFLADPRAADCITLRNVFTSGEALPAFAAQRAREVIGAGVHNLYGSAEAAVDVTYHEVTEDLTVSVPSGAPVSDTRVYVLDSRLHPVPVGVAGELYLAGAQLARGYVARPDSTADRFVADPFGAPGGRMYRTGDLVTRTARGELKQLRRSDFRGLRIELGEIESALTALDTIAQAAVLVHWDERLGEQLVAYVLARARRRIDAEDVRAALRAELPEHLVPASFVVLERFPLDNSGKLDRNALPAPVLSTAAYRAPATRSEATVARIVARSLGVERVGADDDFFALGGNSLLATQAADRLGAALDAEIPASLLFEAPTVATLAARTERLVGAGGPPAPARRPRPGRVPLSPAQQRMWFRNRFGPSDTVDNFAVAVRLTGYLDPDMLAATIGDVICRHETLRTVYPDLDGTGYQRILDPVEVVEIHPLDTSDALREFAAVPFDLTAEVPLRVGLVTRSDRDHVLALVLHHIAADSFSTGVLVRDLATAYTARATRTAPAWADLDVQYADYALWQHRVLGAEDAPGSPAARQLQYWRNVLRDLPIQLDLPADRPRPAVASHAAASTTLALPDDVRDAIAAVAARYEATPFMIVHAALATLLARLSSTTDIVIGALVQGRGHAALDDLIGLFVNTLVLRAEVSGSDTFAAVLCRVREHDLDAFAHADVPFGRVAEVLDPPRSQARHPLFQIALLFQDLAPVTADMAGVSAAEYEFLYETTSFDIQLTVTGGTLRFTYALDLFDAPTIEAFGVHFVRLLAAVTADPEQVVGDIDLFGAGEQHTEREDSAPSALGTETHAPNTPEFPRTLIRPGRRKTE